MIPSKIEGGLIAKSCPVQYADGTRCGAIFPHTHQRDKSMIYTYMPDLLDEDVAAEFGPKRVSIHEQPHILSPAKCEAKPGPVQRVIQFDVDGVLADFNGSFTLEGHLKFGTQVFGDADQADWYYEDEGSMTEEQRREVWDIVYDTPLWWTRLRPLCHSETFHRINQMQRKHEIIFVTNRKSRCEPAGWQTRVWLENQGLDLPAVVVTKKKGQQAEIIGADYSIEDKLENAWAIHWMSDRPQTRSYLIERPYNQLQGRRVGPRLQRVASVWAFLDIIEKESS